MLQTATRSLLSSGTAQVTLTGLVGQSYGIEVSTDLRTWQTLTNVATGTNGTVLFADPSAGNFSQRLYRAVDQ
ncbi:MAG: hypothetical protein ACYDH9_06175 [Limisphaerales bacterium]